MPVDITITRVGGVNKTVKRAAKGGKSGSKGRPIDTKPRFKLVGDSIAKDMIYDRVSKRTVAFANSQKKAQELVSILNRKV
jgi:hypothetical protein